MAIQTDKITYGGDMMLFLNGEPIAFSTSAKLDISLKTRDIGSKDSGAWDEKAAGKLGWTASSDALMSESGLTGTTGEFSALYGYMFSRTKITFVFATAQGTAPTFSPVTTGTKTRFEGSGFITSLSLNAPDGDNATYSVSFEGTGALTPYN